MRRVTLSLPSPLSLLVATTVTAVLTVGLPAGSTAQTADPATGTAAVVDDTDPLRPTDVVSDATEQALDTAAQALAGDAPTQSPDHVELGDAHAHGDDRVEATLALRDLFLARPALGDDDAVLADRLLARPTDGVRDPQGDGYTTRSTKTCSTNVCVHWVRSGADAPPNDAWAQKTRRVMEQVWRHHIEKLGYRRPAPDGRRGGNAKFDVYLVDVGSRGFYGYCAPEQRVAGQPKQASGFCVLDNDFARSEFGREPTASLRVTAAHEFLHAIQYAYDFTEDHWFLESTATWIEERFADSVNDNRSYLKFGQARRSARSLDLFERSGSAHYGNWVLWEFLSERFGNSLIRTAIERAGTGRGLPDDFSSQALARVLKGKGGLPRLYADFAAANTAPAKSYEEGFAFPGVKPISSATLTPRSRRSQVTTRIDHLAAKSVRVTPRSLRSKAWRLRIAIDGPRRRTSPAVSVLVTRANGTIARRAVALDRAGDGRLTVQFSSRRVRSVGVTMANASIRFQCDQGSSFSCKGRPRDQGARFEVSARAFRR